MQERDGILSWMIEGCLAWQLQGLNPPQAVLQATNEYRTESDVLGQWLDDECDVGPNLTDHQMTVFGAYQTACKADGNHPMTKNSFTRKLKERGINTVRAGTRRHYNGVRLKRSPPLLDVAGKRTR